MNRPPAHVDDRVADLYREPPERFVAARDALARALRDGGDRAAAEAVRALRRPDLATWALNQLAHEHPDDLRDLVDQADALRSGAGASTLRERSQRFSRQAAFLASAAEQVLVRGGHAPSGPRSLELAQALRAAPLAEPARSQLLTGRLERLPGDDAGSWFGVAGTHPRAGAKRPDQGAMRLRAQLHDAEQVLRDARAAERRAQREAGRLERAAERARGDAQRAGDMTRRAADRVEELRQELGIHG